MFPLSCTSPHAYPRRQDRNVAGFSLIEMMVVVVILGIFASIAVPNFTGMIQTNRLRAAANELYELLEFTRAQAITSGASVIIAGGSSSPTLWGGDLTVKTVVPSPAVPALLREVGQQGLQSGVTISSSTAGTLTFTPTGTTASTCFTASYTNNTTDHQYITVLSTGRILQPTKVKPTTGGCP